MLEEVATSMPEVTEGLRPLAEEAVKCDTFDEFETAFLRDIKHGRYYHITDNPNFRISPESGPRDMSSMAMGGVEKGKLMITSDPANWIEEYGETRKYVAIIDMSQVPKDEYWQVNRGFGNEFFVNDPSRARVIKVVPVAEAEQDAEFYQEALEETITGSPALEEFYNKVKGIATSKARIEIKGAVMSRWLTPTEFANLVLRAVDSGMSLGEAVQMIREEAEGAGVPDEVIDEGVEIAEEHFGEDEIE